MTNSISVLIACIHYSGYSVVCSKTLKGLNEKESMDGNSKFLVLNDDFGPNNQKLVWSTWASANYLYEFFATQYLTYSTLSLLFLLRNEEGTKDRSFCLNEISACTCQNYTMGSANPNHDDNSFTNGLNLQLKGYYKQWHFITHDQIIMQSSFETGNLFSLDFSLQLCYV